MRASGYPRVVNDYYCEPAWLVDALLNAEPFYGENWDPACGGGNIPERFRVRGLSCRGSDIADRGYDLVNHDFFSSPLRADNIVSNPPYGVIEQFVIRSLDLASGKVAILARLAFLEGQKRRETLFRPHPPARIWFSSRRPSMPPGGTGIKASGGTIAYAWIVWQREYTGPTIADWLPNTAGVNT